MSMINVMATNVGVRGNYFGNGLTLNSRSYGDTNVVDNYGIGPLTANINADGHAWIKGNYFDQQINPQWFPYAGQPAPQPQYYPQPVPQPVPYPVPYMIPMSQPYSASSYASAYANGGSSYPSLPSYGPSSYSAPTLYPPAQGYGQSVSSSVAGPGSYGAGVAGYPIY